MDDVTLLSLRVLMTLAPAQGWVCAKLQHVLTRGAETTMATHLCGFWHCARDRAEAGLHLLQPALEGVLCMCRPSQRCL